MYMCVFYWVFHSLDVIMSCFVAASLLDFSLFDAKHFSYIYGLYDISSWCTRRQPINDINTEIEIEKKRCILSYITSFHIVFENNSSINFMMRYSNYVYINLLNLADPMLHRLTVSSESSQSSGLQSSWPCQSHCQSRREIILCCPFANIIYCTSNILTTVDVTPVVSVCSFVSQHNSYRYRFILTSRRDWTASVWPF